MQPIELHAFSGLTGAHVRRLAASEVSWSDNVNEAGSLSATVRGGDELRDVLRQYGNVVAAISGSRVLHAGYVTHAKRDRAGGTWSVEAGGGLTILDKRLVMNHALASAWRDGTVLIDEDNPPGSWVLRLTGTYRDLVRGLVAESMKWGELPIDLPARQGGSAHDVTYNGWDLAKVSERIGDLCDREDGPEVRFDPELSDSWALRFALRVDTEVVDTHWTWNPLAPGSRVALGDDDQDGGDMCTACYAIGGKDDDKMLIAHAAGSALTSKGWPVLQVANTSHSSVSVLSTLQSYARADVAGGDAPQLSIALQVGIEREVRVGDWADVRVGTGDSDVLALKVVGVKGSSGSDMLDVECRERVT